MGTFAVTLISPIKGFPGYRVSDSGIVWSRHRRLKLSSDKDGYLYVGLHKDKKTYIKKVHRLVLEAFVGPCPTGMEARHFPDGDRTNNQLSNLSWCTHKRNCKDRSIHGTEINGERNGNAKLTIKKANRIRRLYKTGDYTQLGLAKAFSLNKNTIFLIVNNRRWRAA